MKHQLVRETIGGQVYEYVPLGKHIVSSRSVCRGRPTFKYTRIEVAGVLQRLGAGHSVEELLAGYQGRVSRAAIEEALTLAAQALVRQVPPQAGDR
jgi:uncharacterized protein (DUF433 family)